MPSIELQNLSVSYTNPKTKETTPALKGISYVFKEGKMTAILGPSGSGKTTLLKAIANILPYSGEILFDGEERSSLLSLSYVSQEYVLYPMMTVFDNIAFPLKSLGASKKEIVEEVSYISSLLDMRYLWGRKPKELSGGQKQKVALARAMVKHPSLYLFDEPFSNVDMVARLEERELLKKVINMDMATSIYVTHDVNEAFLLSDEIIVLNEGKIIASGDKATLMKSNDAIVRGLLYAKNNVL